MMIEYKLTHTFTIKSLDAAVHDGYFCFMLPNRFRTVYTHNPAVGHFKLCEYNISCHHWKHWKFPTNLFNALKLHGSKEMFCLGLKCYSRCVWMFPWTCKCKFQLSQDHKGVGNVELKWIVSYLVKSECV